MITFAQYVTAIGSDVDDIDEETKEQFMVRYDKLDFVGVTLSGADLSGADLSGADLSGADLSGADLSGAIGYVCLGTDYRNYHFRAVEYIDGWRITAGCRNFTIPEAIKHWTTKGNKDALARVAILEAYS